MARLAIEGRKRHDRLPSVDAAAQDRPVGENRTHFVATAGRVARRFDKSPLATPGRFASRRAARAPAVSSSLSLSSISSTGPASVIFPLFSMSTMPSRALFDEIWNLRTSRPGSTAYRQTNLLFPPASTQDPSAE